jgi:nitrite reductase/ring-hydroxylating ferredoxin subunit
MSWISAIKLGQLKSVGRKTAVIEGHKILFIWHEEKIHAVQAQCPHLGMPLLKGKIDEQCHLVCPFHKSEFNLETGAVECWSPWPPVIGGLLGKLSKPKQLRVYSTRIEGDDILVDVPSE